jgi:azurin
MKKIIISLLVLICGYNSMSQVTVSNQFVVLPVSSVTLTSTGGSGSWNWTEVPAHTLTYGSNTVTDPMTSGATINNANSATATLTNVTKQGTYYFQVTSNGHSAIMALQVRVTPQIPTAYIADSLVEAGDQTLTLNATTYGTTWAQAGSGGISPYTTGNGQWGWWEANAGEADMEFSDNDYGNKRLYTTLNATRDIASNGSTDYVTGHGPQRAEIQRAQTSTTDRTIFMDTGYVYVYEWQGYLTSLPTLGSFSESFIVNGSNGSSTLAHIDKWMYQNHSQYGSPPIALAAANGELAVYENGDLAGSGNPSGNAKDYFGSSPGPVPFNNDNFFIVTHNNFVASLVNSPHTIRVTIKEGVGVMKYLNGTFTSAYTGSFIPNTLQQAFLKVEVDGKQVYLRNNGSVGESYAADGNGYNHWGEDYNIYAGAYSNGNLFGGETQVQTEMNLYMFGTGKASYIFNGAYTGTAANQIQAPYATAIASTVSGNSCTLYGYGNNITGYIVSRYWTQSGAGGTITNINSDTTTVTNLANGTTTFTLHETDNYGVTATTNVVVTNGSSSLLTGIVSYWKLDESSGNAIDAAGGGNNGTVTGATHGVTGKINTAYSFSGTTPKVNCGTNTNLAFTTGTIGCWVNLSTLSPSGDGVIISKGDASGEYNGWALIYEADGLFKFQTYTASGSHTTYTFSTTTLAANTWYYLAVSFNGSSLVTYINGNQVTTTETNLPVTTVYPFVIGNNANAANFAFNGVIDEVGAWNRVLTPAEVTSLYNAGAGNQYPFSGSSSTPSANAGSDQNLSAGTTSTTLTGSGADQGGTITSYAWTQVAGASATITSPSSATTTVTGLSAGTYTFVLTVTDNNSNTAKDSVNVTVAAPSSSLLTGIVSYWKLDESSGNAIDAAGGGNNGTVTGATHGVTGKINTAYSFSGTTPKVNCGTNTNLAFTTGTIGCWVNLSTLSPSGDGVIISKGDASGEYNGWALIYEADGLFKFQTYTASGSHTTYTFSTTTLAANTWYYLAVSFNGSSLVTYINGNQVTTTETNLPVTTVYPFVIGNNANAANFAFNGVIDEVGAWNRVLTPAEVTSLYNAGAGNQYPFSGGSTPVENTGLTANAGPDQNLQLGTNSATLTGSGADVGGKITGYAWTQVAGRSATINTPSSATTAVTGLSAGTSTFALTVTDNNKIAKDSVNIVYPAAALSSSNDLITWSIAPNPIMSKAGFMVIISSEKTSQEQGALVIWDANGRKIFTINCTINPGQNLISVNSNKLDGGVYFTSLFGENINRIGQPQKIIVSK